MLVNILQHQIQKIVLSSPDTDVFFLLLIHTQLIENPVIFESGCGNNRRIINIYDVILKKGKELCFVLPAFYACTGCDSTSAFLRRGKLQLKKFSKNTTFFSNLLQNLAIHYISMTKRTQTWNISCA